MRPSSATAESTSKMPRSWVRVRASRKKKTPMRAATTGSRVASRLAVPLERPESPRVYSRMGAMVERRISPRAGSHAPGVCRTVR